MPPKKNTIDGILLNRSSELSSTLGKSLNVNKGASSDGSNIDKKSQAQAEKGIKNVSIKV